MQLRPYQNDLVEQVRNAWREGYKAPCKERKIEVEEETKLIKVVGFKLDYSGPEQCQSYAELVEYAKQHGYKRGWAFYQAKKRGMIA